MSAVALDTIPRIRRRRVRCAGCEKCARLPKASGISYRHPEPGESPAPFPYRVRPNGHPERAFRTDREAIDYWKSLGNQRPVRVVDVDGRRKRKSTWTVAAFVEQVYFPAKTDWSYNTRRKRSNDLALVRRYRRFAEMPVADVQRRDVVDFLDYLTTRPGRGVDRIGWSTIESVRMLLSGAFAMAFHDGVRSTRLDLPPTPRLATDGQVVRRPAEVVPPTADDIRELYDAMEASGDWLLPIFRLAPMLGMRVGEWTALRRSNVDLAARKITIESTYVGRTRSKTTGEMVDLFDRPKSKRSRRRIGFGDDVAKILADWFAYLDRIQAGQTVDPRRFVVPNPDRDFGPMSAEVIGRHLSRAAEASTVAERRRADGVEPIRFHDFRHFFVTERIGKSKNRDALARYVGDTVATLERVYIHWTDDGDVADDVVAI